MHITYWNVSQYWDLSDSIIYVYLLFTYIYIIYCNSIIY